MRYILVLLLSLITAVSSAATARSKCFVVTAASDNFATAMCQAAETYRRDLALEWFGYEMQPWKDPCYITAQIVNQPPGGVTSFVFADGVPGQWRMTIRGQATKLLDSALPHEVMHMLMATHIGQPIIRWADEGAAINVEPLDEHIKTQRMLVGFLSTGRGIGFDRMFAMRDYPRDILPLYAQGYSLAKYLIQRGGKQRYIAYVTDGTKSNNWTETTKKHYRFTSLKQLQDNWNNWVIQGSPGPAPAQLASVPIKQAVGTPPPNT